MQAAVEGRGDSATKLLAVTVLTSFSQNDLADLGHSLPFLTCGTAREKGR